MNGKHDNNCEGLGDSQSAEQTKRCELIFGEKLFVQARKRIHSVVAVKVADFAQYWNGVKILFCSDASRLTKQVLGKRYPFCQKMGTKAEKCGFPKKSHLAEKKKEAR